ncbi:hypothetical protein BPNPMPFG_005664 [Mesorhizobium sp. AR07]|nr:hypothetical protein [Mesorhizobium sp. AR07]UVK43823.1 hypothetical protein BPNPMPFG_005664 [Mesorhizobium sp. AR07]
MTEDYHLEGMSIVRAAKAGIPVLSLAALGIVFGDIGTSPSLHLQDRP